MIPIIDIPKGIQSFLKPFEISFHQKRHMQRYVSGLISSENKTITGITSQIMDDSSSKALNRFLTEYKWDDKEVNKQRLEELQKHNETRWSKHGVGIIDDTLIEKTGKNIAFSGKFYDHSENRFIHGINLLTLNYADNKVNYPVDFEIYEKESQTDEEKFKTKIELAMKLIKNSKMPVNTFVFDSWYTCEEVKNFIEKEGKFWIGACKSTLLVRTVSDKFVSLTEYEELNKDKFVEYEINGKKYSVFTKTVYMKSLEKVRIIISRDSEGVIYLATNRKDHFRHVLSDYMLRWKVEAFYKDSKQHLGLGDCQIRKPQGIVNHFTMVFLSHSILRLGVSENKLLATIGKNQKRVITEILERFVYWILEKGESAMKDLEGVLLKYRQS